MENELQFTEIEQLQEEHFEIKDDKTAEWALKKIRQLRLSHERFATTCQHEIAEHLKEIERIQHKQDEDKASLSKSEDYFTGLLAEYYHTLPNDLLTKPTKTQQTYKLGNGKIIYKFPTTRLKHDDKALLASLDAISATELIRVKREPNWAIITKLCTTKGDTVTLTYECETVDPETGEIIKTTNKVEGIPGIGIEAIPGEIKVEVD